MIVRQTVLQVHSHCIFIQETIRWIFHETDSEWT